MDKMDQNNFVIEDGAREYRFVNKYGAEIATIHFRPADAGMVERFEHMQDELMQMVKPITSTPGTASDKEKLEAYRQTEANIRKQFNELFGSDDMSKLFDKVSPLNLVNGEPFCLSITRTLGEIIRQAVEEEQAKATDRGNASTGKMPTT